MRSSIPSHCRRGCFSTGKKVMPTPYAPVRAVQNPAAALAREKLVRNLEENAGAIPGFGIASAVAAVRQVEQHLDSLSDDVVTFAPTNVGDKPDPAGVMLVRRMVQALGGWWTTRLFCRNLHIICSVAAFPASWPLSASVVLELRLCTRCWLGVVGHFCSGTHLCEFLVTDSWA